MLAYNMMAMPRASGAGSGVAGVAAATPETNGVWHRHTPQKAPHEFNILSPSGDQCHFFSKNTMPNSVSNIFFIT